MKTLPLGDANAFSWLPTKLIIQNRRQLGVMISWRENERKNADGTAENCTSFLRQPTQARLTSASPATTFAICNIQPMGRCTYPLGGTSNPKCFAPDRRTQDTAKSQFCPTVPRRTQHTPWTPPQTSCRSSMLVSRHLHRLLTVSVALGAPAASRGISSTASEASQMQQQAAYAPGRQGSNYVGRFVELNRPTNKTRRRQRRLEPPILYGIRSL